MADAMLDVMIEHSSNQSTVARPLRLRTSTGPGSSSIQPICCLDNFEGLDLMDFACAVTLLELDNCNISNIAESLPSE
jgi:hypothetical protein